MVETVMPRRSGSETLNFGIKQVYKRQISPSGELMTWLTFRALQQTDNALALRILNFEQLVSY